MTVNNPPEKLSPGGELPGTERRRYGVNNPVGNIPIETPMLKRIWKAAMDAFLA